MKLTGKFTPVHVMKICGGVQVRLHLFLTLAMDRDEWSPSRLVILPLSGHTHDTH
jgi:hypothetical protein